jgi:hypothetical protein
VRAAPHRGCGGARERARRVRRSFFAAAALAHVFSRRVAAHRPSASYDQYAGAWDTAVTANVMGQARAHPSARAARPTAAPTSLFLRLHAQVG